MNLTCTVALVTGDATRVGRVISLAFVRCHWAIAVKYLEGTRAAGIKQSLCWSRAV